jgi:hypothetical protein
VRHIRKSEKRKRAFKKLKGDTKAGLHPAVETRWNSTIEMLRSVLNNKVYIERYLSSLTREEQRALGIGGSAAWNNMELIVQAMHPLEELLNESEGDSYVTASRVPVWYNIVRDACFPKSDQEKDMRIVEAALSGARAKLLEYRGRVSDFMFAAAFLDPRLKTYAFELSTLDHNPSYVMDRVTPIITPYVKDSGESRGA